MMRNYIYAQAAGATVGLLIAVIAKAIKSRQAEKAELAEIRRKLKLLGPQIEAAEKKARHEKKVEKARKLVERYEAAKALLEAEDGTAKTVAYTGN